MLFAPQRIILPAMAGTIGQRLRDRRKELGKTQAEIGKLCGMTKQAISQLENDVNEPSGEKLVKLANALHLSEMWIMSGSQQKEGKGRPMIDTIESEIGSGDTSLVRGFRIDEMDIRASSGPGTLVERDNKRVGEWELPRDLIRSATNSPTDRIKVITIIGDSMQPILHPGEKVVVDTGNTIPTPPGVFIVWDGLGLVAKTVSYIAHSDPPRVKISSENPKYESYECIVDEAYIQGRVIGKCWVLM